MLTKGLAINEGPFAVNAIISSAPGPAFATESRQRADPSPMLAEYGVHHSTRKPVYRVSLPTRKSCGNQGRDLLLTSLSPFADPSATVDPE